MLRLRLIALGWLAWAGLSARAEIEFNGILVTSQRTLFSLADTATGESQWRRTGDAFAGFTIGAFDPKSDSLVLTKDQTTTRILLKDAKVRPARLELTGVLKLSAGTNIQVDRATLIVGQENVFPVGEGLTWRITPQQRDDGTIVYRASFERVLAPNKIERIATPNIITRPNQAFGLKIDEVEFSFSPRAL